MTLWIPGLPFVLSRYRVRDCLGFFFFFFFFFFRGKGNSDVMDYHNRCRFVL